MSADTVTPADVKCLFEQKWIGKAISFFLSLSLKGGTVRDLC